jgi:hypothetical protein
MTPQLTPAMLTALRAVRDGNVRLYLESPPDSARAAAVTALYDRGLVNCSKLLARNSHPYRKPRLTPAGVAALEACEVEKP